MRILLILIPILALCSCGKSANPNADIAAMSSCRIIKILSDNGTLDRLSVSEQIDLRMKIEEEEFSAIQAAPDSIPSSNLTTLPPCN